MEKKLSGKPVANAILDRIKLDLANLDTEPVLCAIKFGNDPASDYYFNNIAKQGGKIGINTQIIDLSAIASTAEVLQLIEDQNNNRGIHGIIIQKPLPADVDEEAIAHAISPVKDIDGINPVSLGRLFLGLSCFMPCTASAVIETLKHYAIPTTGKHAVILGRSPVVAKPLAMRLLAKSEPGNATVTVCHSKSENLALLTRSAEILITAIGKANYISPDHISPGTVCLDVGINCLSDPEKGEIFVGDIDYQACYDKAGAITPVPGGIGTITTAVLLSNVVKAVSKINDEKKH